MLLGAFQAFCPSQTMAQVAQWALPPRATINKRPSNFLNEFAVEGNGAKPPFLWGPFPEFCVPSGFFQWFEQSIMLGKLEI